MEREEYCGLQLSNRTVLVKTNLVFLYPRALESAAALAGLGTDSSLRSKSRKRHDSRSARPLGFPRSTRRSPRQTIVENNRVSCVDRRGLDITATVTLLPRRVKPEISSLCFHSAWMIDRARNCGLTVNDSELSKLASATFRLLMSGFYVPERFGALCRYELMVCDPDRNPAP